MDVVAKQARSGSPWELLYADDLVLMATTGDELGRKLVEWRASLLVKGLAVNAGKTEPMVCGGSGGVVVAELGAWSCVVPVMVGGGGGVVVAELGAWP